MKDLIKTLAIGLLTCTLAVAVVGCESDDEDGDATTGGDTSEGDTTEVTLDPGCAAYVTCCVANSMGRSGADATCTAGAIDDLENDPALCDAELQDNIDNDIWVCP
jgi:hypothetical protein